MPSPLTGDSPIQTIDFDLQVLGQRLHARRLVPSLSETKRPANLVFLHEGLGCIAQWGDFPEALVRATGLPALLYDRLGHGESAPLMGPRSPHYLEEEASSTLPRVLALCEIDSPVLIGHSDGASIALLYASEFPHSPVAVLSEAAHVFLEEITLAGIRRAVAAFDQGKLRKGLLPYHGDKVDALFWAWADTWLSPAFRDWDITSRLPALRAPLLMIQGEEDGYGSPAQVEAILSRVGGPKKGWLIPGCGHAPHQQARQAVLEGMASFLQALLRPATL